MMDVKTFIKQYDKEDSIILLEGKRKLLDEDKEKLIALGRLLAGQTSKMQFRSGNAAGTDLYFSIGVAEIDRSRLQVITPYSGHRKKYNQADDTIALDTLNLAAEDEVVYQSKQNKKMKNVIDQYISGVKNRNSIKAAYILRDTMKVTGAHDVKPATFGIFYDDLANPVTGGTGHTMEVCKRLNVPVIDQTVWFKWVE